MPRKIYNEGRVVGMSAYEIYLRHQMSEYPDIEPATEREWLASTLGSGYSLIMRIPSGTEAGVYDKPLPAGSELCAAGAVTASVFDGQVALDDTRTWATKVIGYGPLISNTETSHPETPGDIKEKVPVGQPWTEEQRAHLKEYMKIIDGLVYQPGVWEASNDEDGPAMDLKEPSLNHTGRVRLNISKKLERDVFIVLTGWVHRAIVAGSTKIMEGALDPIRPWNGDFLGPERFPWAVKVVFTVPTEVMHILNDKGYIRQLVSGQLDKAVVAKPVVDYDSTDIRGFFGTNDTTSYPNNVADSKIPVNVTELNVTGDGACVIGAYQRKDRRINNLTGENYPPIIYGLKATVKGEQEMVPLDVGAPGTVKIFDDKTKAINYPKIIPNTYSLFHDRTTHSIYLVDGDDTISLDTKMETVNKGSASSPKFTTHITSGKKEVEAVSLLNDKDQRLNTDGTAGVINVFETGTSGADQNLSWTTLLAALGLNKMIDLIGAQLRRFRRNLPNVTSGDGGILNITGTGDSTIAGKLTVKKDLNTQANLNVNQHATVTGGLQVNGQLNGFNASTAEAEFKFNKPIKSGADYIVFSNGLRLYVSGTAPSPNGVPIGSIGIGW